MDLYAETILDHFHSPRHKRDMDAPTVTHSEKNLSCGDEVTLKLKLNNDVVEEIAWSGEGCAISQAGMSMLAEELIGKPLTDIDQLTPQHMRDLLGVPIGHRRIKCALLSLHTLKNTIHLYRDEPQQTWMETVGNDEKAS